MFIKAVSCIFSSHFTYSPWVISSQFHNFWFLVFPGHTIPLCHTSHTYLPIRYLFLSDSLEPQTCVQKLNLSFIFFLSFLLFCLLLLLLLLGSFCFVFVLCFSYVWSKWCLLPPSFNLVKVRNLRIILTICFLYFPYSDNQQALYVLPTICCSQTCSPFHTYRPVCHILSH